ncbi:uncharacterized protein LOC124367528 [Homalodisca vitripennis]|uniref:uncharacterized protein LOC124367528 n=1 Tax=Homalodisca vitripennis TaxID=197043 RepID=UPI001EEAFEEE|nr:uncharacterized protein LOC124367528 [Homalodisca vitripennis]
MSSTTLLSAHVLRDSLEIPLQIAFLSLHHQLNHQGQIHATHLPVAPMPSVLMESAPVYRNIKEILTQGVGQSVSSTLTVQETEPVSATSVRTLVLELVVRELNAMSSTIFLSAAVLKECLAILSSNVNPCKLHQ